MGWWTFTAFREPREATFVWGARSDGDCTRPSAHTRRRLRAPCHSAPDGRLARLRDHDDVRRPPVPRAARTAVHERGTGRRSYLLHVHDVLYGDHRIHERARGAEPRRGAQGPMCRGRYAGAYRRNTRIPDRAHVHPAGRIHVPRDGHRRRAARTPAGLLPHTDVRCGARALAQRHKLVLQRGGTDETRHGLGGDRDGRERCHELRAHLRQARLPGTRHQGRRDRHALRELRSARCPDGRLPQAQATGSSTAS